MTKTCNKCQKTKPLTEFRWREDRKYHMGTCLKCSRADAMEARRLFVEAHPPSKFRRCPQCRSMRPLGEFEKDTPHCSYCMRKADAAKTSLNAYTNRSAGGFLSQWLFAKGEETRDDKMARLRYNASITDAFALSNSRRQE
jgi:hypothetical protein